MLQQFTFFFFKQKTAYEIGLGIPAEPLFRSVNSHTVHDGGYYTVKDCVTIDVLPRTPGNNVYVGFMVWSNFRSEERRVGKECRFRGWAERCTKEESAGRV